MLVVRDGLSSYMWLFSAKNATAYVAASEFARSIRNFTIMEMWISHQGSHFKKEGMRELTEEHRMKHFCTVAYSPCVNGTVKAV